MNLEIVRDCRVKHKRKTLNLNLSSSTNWEVSNLSNKSKLVKKVKVKNSSGKSPKLDSCETVANKSNTVDEQCVEPRKVKKAKRRVSNIVTTLLTLNDKLETSPNKVKHLEGISDQSSSSCVEKTASVNLPKEGDKTKDKTQNSSNMGIPEIIISDDTPLSSNSKSPVSKIIEQDVIFLECDTPSRKINSPNESVTPFRKRKSFNESVVILQEVNREPETSPPAKRKCVNGAKTNGENVNDGVINLCDDDVSIVEVDIVSPKPKSTPAEDIILLDPSPKVDERPNTLGPVAIKGRKRKGTCTVTSGGGGSGSVSTNYNSMLNVFRQAVETIVDNTVSSTSTCFAFDKGGSQPYRFRNEHGRGKFRSGFSSAPKKSTSTYAPAGASASSSKIPAAAADGSNPYGNNIYNPNPQTSQSSGALRPIIIDGSNVALGHSGGARIFSCRGLQICVNYFAKRGHRVIAFVPQFRRSDHSVPDKHIFDELQKAGQIVFTPSRRVDGRLVVSYDDRYIVQYAAEFGGIIVSTDNYRDLLEENEAWRDTIQNRLLMFTWVGDLLMFPLDPLGRHGPKLDEFLRFPP